MVDDLRAVFVFVAIAFGLFMFILTIFRLLTAQRRLPAAPGCEDAVLRRAAASTERIERISNTLREDLRHWDRGNNGR